jgi:hypothetical protein
MWKINSDIMSLLTVFLLMHFMCFNSWSTTDDLHLYGEDVNLRMSDASSASTCGPLCSEVRLFPIQESHILDSIEYIKRATHYSTSLEFKSTVPEINTSHLDHLFEEIKLNGEKVGIIHIYSEYPDYHWVGDDDEGIACVDDASRAAVFYLRNYNYTGNTESLNKAELLLGFLLNMQAENGYFYNFIWPDHSIHRNGVTTKAEPNWWTWRTLWTFGEALAVLEENHILVSRIKTSRSRLMNRMMDKNNAEYGSMFENETCDTAAGFLIPTWLPAGVAADQAALVLLGLTAVYKSLDGSIEERFIRKLAEGLMIMQVRDTSTFANGVFLSWKNLWHAYGNSQAYALLIAGQTLGDTSMTKAAIFEAREYYPSLLAKGGSSHFWVRSVDSITEVYDEEKFPQIAYNYRPMIWACLEAWKTTGEDLFLHRARKIGSWFTGSNSTGQAMYDAKTGRTFDGIINDTEINRNSGAESTIEALLALQELKRYVQ